MLRPCRARMLMRVVSFFLSPASHHSDGGVHIEKDGQKYSVDEAKQTAVQRGQEAANQAVDEAQRTKA